MAKKQILMSIVVVMILSVSVVFADNIYNIYNSVVNTGNEQDVLVDEPTFSGMPGNELWTETFSVNGVTNYYYRKALVNATTTLISIKGPGVTTTIEYFGFQIDTGTSTASTIEMATSTNAFATSSIDQLHTATVASGATGSFRWISVGGIVQDNIIAPNTWFILRTNEPGEAAEDAGFTYSGNATIRLQAF